MRNDAKGGRLQIGIPGRLQIGMHGRLRLNPHIVNQAVQNRVTEGGIADDVVPGFHGNLAGDNRRCATMAIVEDLQQVAPFGRVENRQAPVVEQEELRAPQRLEQATRPSPRASASASKRRGTRW
jgi:hypothetical protein